MDLATEFYSLQDVCDVITMHKKSSFRKELAIHPILLQLNFNGSNSFETTKIYSRQG